MPYHRSILFCHLSDSRPYRTPSATHRNRRQAARLGNVPTGNTHLSLSGLAHVNYDTRKILDHSSTDAHMSVGLRMVMKVAIEGSISEFDRRLIEKNVNRVVQNRSAVTPQNAESQTFGRLKYGRITLVTRNRCQNSKPHCK